MSIFSLGLESGRSFAVAGPWVWTVEHGQ